MRRLRYLKLHFCDRTTDINWNANLLNRYCPIELVVAENTLFALPPINRIVPTTNTKMTASMTAYSAISWPSSRDQPYETNQSSSLLRTG
jgi:hypothetical protein